MYNNNYILGLDIGISSVGWGILLLDDKGKPYRILDVGSRIFPPGEVEKTGDSRAKERREKRGNRRVIRRREFRVDRVRLLLKDYNFINGNINSNMLSEILEELTIIFDKMINDYYQNNQTTPHILKVEALKRKLTKEELSIILVHYAKKRGYKSNRETSQNNEDGKVLLAIKANEEIMEKKKYETVSEMFIKDEKFIKKLKNSPGDYKISVTRKMYEEEINKVLDSQIKFGLIDENFKNLYLEIWSSQRNYSKGPGGNSPYGGDLIKRMVGKCNFDNNPRAPKNAPSSEIFVSLTKLINLRYKSYLDKDYTNLTKEEIQTIINLSKEKKQITYLDIKKVLNKEEVKFKNLQLSKAEYKKAIDEFKKEIKVEELKINELSFEERTKFDKLLEKKLFSKVLIELKGYNQLKDIITKSFDKKTWKEVQNNYEFLDEIALYCTNYKLNEDIKNEMEHSQTINKKFIEEDFINGLPNFKDHLMLSTEIINKLIPLMLDGNNYDTSMSILGYNHSNLNENIEKKDLLVPINKNNNITNQRVIRSMTQARKIINAIIKKYGSPKIINIETSRELAKSHQERRQIENSQKEKQENNEKLKKNLVDLGIFISTDKITSTDLLKFKLWKEQGEFCAYSREKITIEDLYKENIVQIDHILPYSRTFNDNYNNKTLVFTKNNQDKGNKTPYEWFGKTDKWKEYETFINNLNISQFKKDNYLLRNLDFETEREMREQNLNDTKFISKELSNLIKAYLKVEKVNVYQGSITAKLRARWGFNRLTHSYVSKTYYMPKEMKEGLTKDRDNHLHHAMDALIIASITPSLQQKITKYEKFSRYIEGVTQSKIKEMTLKDMQEYDGKFYNDETGEVDLLSFKDYLKEELSKDNITYKNNIAKLTFPTPYENFCEEAKIRVYEQDIEILKFKLKGLNNYSPKELQQVHTLTPSIAKVKISGAMHEETYYGIKKIENNNDKTMKKYKTIRKPLENIKLKDLENIPDKASGSKDIYNAIIEWFKDAQTGIDALKRNDGKYPINPNDKEHKEIKKIKIYLDYKNTGHFVNGANVDKGGVYRIEVYKLKNNEDNKLYFLALDIFDIEKIKYIKKKNTFDKDFFIKLEYGRGKNNIILPYNKLQDNYELLMCLSKNDLVKITLKDNRTSLAYIVGCSSGLLEVKSKLGDGYDIIGKNNIFNTTRKQYQITISQIKSIEKLRINLLGEINGI